MAPAVEPNQQKLEAALGHKVSTAAFKALCSKYAPPPAFHETRQARAQTHQSNDKQNGRPNRGHSYRPRSGLVGSPNDDRSSAGGQARSPFDTQTLIGVSQDFESTLQEIREEPAWQKFRDQIQKVVKHTSNVSTMICLGLVNWVARRFTHRTKCFVVQYAVFVYMCDKVDERWRNQCASNGTIHEPVRRYFQDPAFDEQTKYLLRHIPDSSDSPTNNIIVDPAASKMIKNNKDIFAFAPHLNCNIWREVLSFRPQVFIGNSPRGFGGRDMAATETYIQECVITNTDDVGPQFKALLAGFKATDIEYRQSDFEQGPVDPDHLANLTIYQRLT